MGKHVQMGEIRGVREERAVGPGGGHTLFVIIWYLEGLGVCVNDILAKIWIAYLRVSFPGGRVNGRRVGEGVESRLMRQRQECLADGRIDGQICERADGSAKLRKGWQSEW